MENSASVTTNLLAHYPHVPLFYLVARDLDTPTLEKVEVALAITPISFAIITDPADAAYAAHFAEHVFQVVDDEAAYTLAYNIYESSGSPRDARSVCIRSGDPLVAVYQSGRETIAI